MELFEGVPSPEQMNKVNNEEMIKWFLSFFALKIYAFLTSFIFSRSSPICRSRIAVYENTFPSSNFLSRISANITWKAIAIPVCYRYFLNI